MIEVRPTVLLLSCIGALALTPPVVLGQDGGIIEGMAIEEIAEEGVKAAVIAGVLSGAEAEQLGEAAELIYDSPDERTQEPGEVDREFIEMLGTGLKAEVEQGRMDESDAWSIYLGAVADVRTWYNNYPVHVFGAEAKQLLDGMFNDGMGYSPNTLHNTNLARHDAW